MFVILFTLSLYSFTFFQIIRKWSSKPWEIVWTGHYLMIRGPQNHRTSHMEARELTNYFPHMSRAEVLVSLTSYCTGPESSALWFMSHITAGACMVLTIILFSVTPSPTLCESSDHYFSWVLCWLLSSSRSSSSQPSLYWPTRRSLFWKSVQAIISNSTYLLQFINKSTNKPNLIFFFFFRDHKS